MSRSCVLIALILVATACGGGSTRELTESDSGSVVDVEIGDVIEIRLEENPSTGYTWELEAPPASVELTNDVFVSGDNTLVGGAGTRQLDFAVIEEEAGILRLEYLRPFDDPPVAEKVVEYIVVVGDATWPPDQTDSTPATSTETAP